MYKIRKISNSFSDRRIPTSAYHLFGKAEKGGRETNRVSKMMLGRLRALVLLLLLQLLMHEATVVESVSLQVLHIFFLSTNCSIVSQFPDNRTQVPKGKIEQNEVER